MPSGRSVVTMSDEKDQFQRNYWSTRAREISDPELKSIADPAQRQVETKFVLKHLQTGDKVLEIGCGSGVMTKEISSRVAHVTALDLQPDMIESAREYLGTNPPRNVELICDNFLTHEFLSQFDVVISSRVVINFPSLEDQEQGAILFGSLLGKGGRLMLLEGFRAAFDELNALRAVVGLERIHPAPVNLYLEASYLDLLRSLGFVLTEDYENGLYDVITRVVGPALKASGTDIDNPLMRVALADIAETCAMEPLDKYSRVRGGLFVKSS